MTTSQAFEAALAMSPGHAIVTAGLKRAREAAVASADRVCDAACDPAPKKARVAVVEGWRVVEREVPLSESVMWRLQKAFYEDSGELANTTHSCR